MSESTPFDIFSLKVCKPPFSQLNKSLRHFGSDSQSEFL